MEVISKLRKIFRLKFLCKLFLRVLVMFPLLFLYCFFQLFSLILDYIPIFTFVEEIRIPQPKGNFSVSMSKVSFSSGSRSRTAQIYMPFSESEIPCTLNKAPYVSPKYPVLSSLRISRSSFLYEDLDQITENSYPVVIFSHGYISMIELHSWLFEEISSHGFVVIAVSHENAAQIIDQIDQVKVYYTGYISNQKVEHGANDISFILDELNTNTGYSNIRKRMNFNSVTTIGHSYGGAVALCAAKNYTKIKHVIALDPWKSFHTENKNILLLLSEGNTSELVGENVDVKILKGFTHNTFVTDLLLIIGTKNLIGKTLLGNFEPHEAFEMLSENILQFLKNNLSDNAKIDQ